MRKIESEKGLLEVIELRDSVRASTDRQRKLVTQTGAIRAESAKAKKKKPVGITRRQAWDLWQLSLFEFTALRHQLRILDYYLTSRKALSTSEFSTDLAKTGILTLDQQAAVTSNPRPFGALRSLRKTVREQIATVDEVRMARSHMLWQLSCAE